MTRDSWEPLSEDSWYKVFPLKVLGADFNRTVTVVRLDGVNVLVHSTAPFTEEDYRFFHSLGSQVHFAEATCLHDTYTKQVLQNPAVERIYAPENFPIKDSRIRPLAELETALGEAVEMIPLRGMPKINEVEFFDTRHGILIIADLLFNFAPHSTAWTKGVLRIFSGISVFPDMSRLFRMMIKDRNAFRKSVGQLKNLEFDKLVVAHNQVITEEAKVSFLDGLKRHGF